MSEQQSVPTQLFYPLDKDSASVVERIILQTKWPQSRWPNVGRIIVLKVLDDATVLTTGDGKVIFNVPEELDNTLLIAAHAFVTTVSSSGVITVQIRNVTDSVDLLTTAITIDASEFDSYTAATPPLINFTNAQLSKSDRIAIDVDGAGTGVKGLSVYLSIQS